MPQNTTETPAAYVVPLTCPTNGDPVDGPGMKSFADQLAKRFTYFLERVLGAEDDDEVDCDLPGAGTSAWVFGGAGSAYALNQDSAASASIVFIKLPLPKKGVLTSVTAMLAGTAGHAGLPGTMPKIDLFRQDTGSTGAPTSLGSTTDTAANAAAYETPHAVAITGLSEAFEHDSGNAYYVRVTGEAGANALAGLALLRLFATVDPS